MSEAVDNVVKAWTDAGPYPPEHHRQAQRLRDEWPALANALDELSSLVQRPHKRFGLGDRVVVTESRSRHNRLAGQITKVLEDSIFDYRVKLDGGWQPLAFQDAELAKEPI